MSKKFEGFEVPSFTPTPDVFFDQIMTEIKTLCETRIMLYIIRRTYGFGKQSDGISLGQFERGITTSDGRVLDKGVGFTRSVICKALNSLLHDGYIVKETRKSKKGGSDPSVYRLNIKQPQKPIEQGGSVTRDTRVVSHVTPGGSVTENTRVVSHVTPTRNSNQNTVNTKYSEQEEEEGSSVPDHSVSSSSSSSFSKKEGNDTPDSSKHQENVPLLSEAASNAIRLFKEVTGERVGVTPNLINNLNEVVKQHPDVTVEQLLECRTWVKQTSTGTRFISRQPCLTEIAMNFSSWYNHTQKHTSSALQGFYAAHDTPAMIEKRKRRLEEVQEQFAEAMANQPFA